MEVDELLHVLPEPALVLLVPSGIVRAVNSRFEQVFGFVITSCAGKSLAELSFCELAEQRSLLSKFTAKAAPGPFELKCCSAAGSEGEVTFAITELSEKEVLLLARDVTSERKKWHGLSRRAEILQRAFDSSLDAISLSRLRDRTYLEVNEGFLRSGYTREQVIGRTDRDLRVWAAPSEFARFVTALQRDGYVYNMEASFRLPDGNVVPALISARIVQVQGESCVIAFTRGIAQLKETQRQLEQARAAALAASKAKSEFLATISHEIRTPMNAIIGATELLQDTELAAGQRAYLDTIVNNSQALLELLNSVLDVAKIESGKLSLDVIDFDLPVLVAETTNALKIRADEKGIALKVRIHPHAPRLFKDDPLRLRQVLTNLIGNAIKFTEDGAVTLAVEITGGVENGKVGLHFSVTDTGIGIAADRLNEIFAPVRQADSSVTHRYGGSGLGLQFAAVRDFGLAVTVAEKAVMTDAREAVRQHLEQEAADELCCLQHHGFWLTVVTVIFPTEAQLAVLNVEQAIIRNGHAMGIARQIVEHLLSPSERALGVDHPLGLPEW